MNTDTASNRLQSLDFFRGLIMVLLALEAARLFEELYEATHWPVWLQFFHHPWNGLRFWDLIQPGFMFIAGVGMALSLTRQFNTGTTWHEALPRMALRCAMLFGLGVLNYAVRDTRLSFELWNVLTQLSFTLMLAFLIFNWSATAQILISLALLILIECLYRFTGIPGFDQPFTDQQNFGNYMDLILMHKINSDGWVAINCIPTAAHTIWGVLAGKLILTKIGDAQKIKYLIAAGLAGLVIGYSLDATVTPIIKRISTSSFVFASGGWCLLMLALCYWWIDMREHRRYLFFFTVVGMNSIFIYLFFEIVGARWFNGYVAVISNSLLQIVRTPHELAGIITSLVVFALEWGMCLWLYKKNIFFRV